MRAAILGNRANSFILPMAEGLQRMFTRIDVEAHVFYDGLRTLYPYTSPAGMIDVLRTVKRTLVDGLSLGKLRTYDVVIVVNHMPHAFMKRLRVERIRRVAPRTPVVLYDLVYLPTRGPWGRWLRQGSSDVGIPPGQYGMERYDWYLCVAVVSDTAVPEGPQPYSLIGLDLDDGTLFPEQEGEFLALVDFERPRHMAERARQIQALEESQTKYVVLNGSYTRQEIRRIYRKCSAYFLAHRESFGLPICELQACGSHVLTPYDHWCGSHWIKDVRRTGPGTLSSNFIVYENDHQRLMDSLNRLKTSHRPSSVIETFRQQHPQLWRGDERELRGFVEKVEQGEIHARCHASYASRSWGEATA
jgi:hypothetical protein